MRTLDLLASDSSHLPLLYVFKESKVMEKYGYEIDLHIVGGAKAPTMAHRAKLALAGEIDFLSGLHHETYRERAKGEKRLTYLAQAQNNWDDRLVALPEINNVEDLKGRKIVCHSKAPCVSGNLRAVLRDCGLKPQEIDIDVIDDTSGKFLDFVDEITDGKAVAALVDMDLIAVDDLAAAKADSGDLVEACQTRIARWEDIVPLEKFVADGTPQPRPKRIFFQSNGIADEDLAVGKYVLDQAKRKKLKLRTVTEI